MLQPRRGADLAQESFAAKRGAQVGMQHLDGDIAIVFEIVREVDGGHAALTQLAFKAVAVAQRSREAVENGHGMHCGTIDRTSSCTRMYAPTVTAARASSPTGIGCAVCHTEDILRRGLHSAAARADTIGITGDAASRERWSFAEEADGNLSLHVGTCVFTSNTPAAPGEPAKNLMVRVVRDGEQKVRVALPARSARWLLDLIPDEVVE